MFDFRLKVFHVVAKRLNFTRAAEELFITQPAVSKHIHEIEAYYRTKLFERNGTRIKLTPAGKVLMKYTEQLQNIYRNIDLELGALSKDVRGELRIGASTTVANYFLPGYLASFRQKYPDVNVQLTAQNTEHIENLLSEGRIDAGIVEGQSKRQHIKYTALVKDEIVLCTRTNNPAIRKTQIALSELEKLPLVVREPGSGSLEVIISALKNAGVNFNSLKIEMELENTESIKQYLLHSNAFAFLSVHAVFDRLKSGELKIMDLKGLEIERYFYLITPQGDNNPLLEFFHRHLSSDNL